MKLLLDTHSFLWAVMKPESLSSTAKATMDDPSNELFLSIASLWEATIKAAQGKMDIPDGNIDGLIKTMRQYRVATLAIAPEHLRALQLLPDIHRDPFDRLLIAQAQAEQMPLVTIDSKIAQYDVTTIW